MVDLPIPDGPQPALLAIERLVQFALQRGLIEPLDQSAARNSLLDLFRFAEPYEGEVPEEELDNPVSLLEPLLDYGAAIGLIPESTATYRDLLDARIMGLLLPRPSETAAAFAAAAAQQGMKAATDRFYQLNIDSHYIQMDRIRKNLYWLKETEYGNLEITVNLSKPEKDPKEIALLKTLPQAHYPKCPLCADNVGYAGHLNHPARQNLRVLPVTLQGEQWYFQYSPYVYYNEHCIVLKGAHEPMAITPNTFARLLDFVEQFPHYFVGSNADLPIVGGSILNHDHFQGGRHTFPMETAPVGARYTDPGMPDIRFGIVEWPMSVVRINGNSKDEVYRASCRLLDAWRGYSDEQADIYAYTESGGSRTPHNTITPIARLRDNGEYEMDLVLRNNRTSEEHPHGIFHPHSNLHHIKKENIGLIEVMGLAVLPGRLKSELERIASYLTGQPVWDESALQDASHPLHQHAGWIKGLLAAYGTANSMDEAMQFVREETGGKFLEVLKDAGVYKRTPQGLEAFCRFLEACGLQAE
ncbi:UDP-glucose--hexose-1-phosphate uridylyltransferase [Paenibacillus protaetiae]|uniref:Galactose-1-phosphate uridylyltransferase n=1 Tax=Paenibacillus protaetiae TaxID=2509456 RepID=A0A4P6F1I1_9BACL|nr:UDP-glucose--hexose-1-phosphate uridylyltransferase [Paenibacillus protaetiae]QAY66897.1 UDP-glucose--hexose-1-phosphate uridylyltransferase [Paenibacillus protaetiae]